MAEKNEYFTQKLENGTLQISEDVVASVAAAAVLEVEGVCGLSSNISTDIAEMLGMKTMARGIRLTPMKDGAVKIECDVVAKFGQSVFSLAKTVQDAVKSSVESVAGLTVAQVNVEGIKEITKSKPFACVKGFFFGSTEEKKQGEHYDKIERQRDRLPSRF